jgi:hypothetical protein
LGFWDGTLGFWDGTLSIPGGSDDGKGLKVYKIFSRAIFYYLSFNIKY